MAWKGYVVCDRAMVDPKAAWLDALALRSYELDQAISQSQVLYFVATMADFVPPTIGDSNQNGDGSDHGSSSGQDTSNHRQSMCSENFACVALGLTGGHCCPTTAGIQLDCCSSASSGTTREEGSTVSSSPASASQQQETSSVNQSCSSNTACAALDLVGSCCPTESGVRLGCCDDSTS